MGLTQSTPDQPPDGTSASNAIGGQQDGGRAPPRPISPPYPSRSSLNPSSTRRSAFSYFLPISHPDLQHSHLNPTLDDIRKTADILSARLPPELVVRVLDEAKYWAGCRTLIQKDLKVIAGHVSPRLLHPPRAWRNGQENEVGLPADESGNVWYLASERIGCDETRPRGARGDSCWLRGMVIETLSKDQGWSSAVQADRALYGTYDQSYSWFDVALVRDGKEVDDTRRSFQNNIHAGQYLKPHRNVFGQDDDIIRKAEVGDRVVIWARAQYPGWQNDVREAAITLYTAPFPPQL